MEHAVGFSCKGATLFGVLHQPDVPSPRGVLVVVGGPQTRVGSHRQFLLLARSLSDNGTPVLRFDYRGMGDSQGDMRTFEAIAPDIRAAIDLFFAKSPSLREVILWGLCDAASAATFYAPSDPRVSGLVLLNPWVRSERGLARAYLRHYYVSRLFSKETWARLFKRQIALKGSLTSVLSLIRASFSKRLAAKQSTKSPVRNQPATEGVQGALSTRMYNGLKAFSGPTLFILSGNDLTAAEFLQTIGADRKWKRLLRAARFTRRDIPDADHTFSSHSWRQHVEKLTNDWLTSW